MPSPSKVFIGIILICICCNSLSQNSGENGFIKIIKPLKNGTFEITELAKDSTLLYKGKLSSKEPEIRSGIFYFFNTSSKLEVLGQYEKDIPVGNWIYFDDDGDTLFTANYTNVLKFLMEEEEEYTLNKTEIYIVENHAIYNGGDPSIEFTKYLENNLIYPQYTMLKGITGRLIVQFAVDTLGRVRNPQLVRPSNSDFNMEALRVISLSPAWDPGLISGQPVNMLFSWPIDFPPHDQSLINVISPKKEDFRSPLVMLTSNVDIPPKYKGKDPTVSFTSYIARHLKYPEYAAENGISGRVVVQFTVERDGTIDSVSILAGADRTLEEEAIRVVKSSIGWSPGYSNDNPIPVVYNYPVNFVLD